MLWVVGSVTPSAVDTLSAAVSPGRQPVGQEAKLGVIECVEILKAKPDFEQVKEASTVPGRPCKTGAVDFMTYVSG